jgi:hypothetical protein
MVLDRARAIVLRSIFPGLIVIFARVALAATGAFSTVSAPPGACVRIACTLSEPNESTAVVMTIRYPADTLTLFNVSLAPSVVGKQLTWRSAENEVRVAIYGGDTPLPAGTVFFLDFCTSPTAEIAASYPIEAVGASAAKADSSAEPISFGSGSYHVLPPLSSLHSADRTGDWRISLSELLRVVQFYNSSAFHCDAGTEDGYAPESGDTSCPPHSSDYAPTDWRISVSELLRLIQFFNTVGGSYRPDVNGEDGFVPGPFE